MTGGLVLRLRPHEKFLVNGVVIENGARRTRLRVKTQDAHILRIREALHPEEADTPSKRLYYIAQLAVSGDAEGADTIESLVSGLESLRVAFGEQICAAELEQAVELAKAGEFYRVMRALSRIMPIEEALLNGVPAGGEDSENEQQQ